VIKTTEVFPGEAMAELVVWDCRG